MTINLSFTGIKPPYYDKNGNHITPISRIPSQDDVLKAINVTKAAESSKRGYNGTVYWLEDDYT